MIDMNLMDDALSVIEEVMGKKVKMADKGEREIGRRVSVKQLDEIRGKTDPSLDVSVAITESVVLAMLDLGLARKETTNDDG